MPKWFSFRPGLTNVDADLGQNCLQNLSEDDKSSRYVSKDRVFCFSVTFSKRKNTTNNPTRKLNNQYPYLFQEILYNLIIIFFQEKK